MTYPIGVKTSTLTFSNPKTHGGKDADRTVITVQPTASIVWAATGEPLDDFAETITPMPGAPGFFTAPCVDQPGVRDQSGNAFTMWAYTITRQSWLDGFPGRPVRKTWQPLIGQPEVDFDTLPGGSIGLPMSVPIPPVTSVNGKTLAVTVVEATAENVAAVLPERLSVDNLAAGLAPKLDAAKVGAPDGVAPLGTDARVPDANLPGRLTEASLKATFGTVRSIMRYAALAGTFGENWTPAFNAALAAAEPGETIFYPQRTTGGGYLHTTALDDITKPNIRILGVPRDGYAMALKFTTPGLRTVKVKAPGVVFQDLAFVGDSPNTNGAGATVLGPEIFGDVDGNCDTEFRGVTFQGLAEGYRTHGRNVKCFDSLFSNCLKMIIIDGKDAVYHTGPNADQNRGNVIKDNRFHNIGNTATDSAIEITSTAKVLHALITGNYFDSNGLGRHIVALGTAADPHKGLTMCSNKHTETQADVYDLTYVVNSTIRDTDISGNAGPGGSLSNGFVLNNTDTLIIENVLGVQLGKSGVYARNNARLRLTNVQFRAIGTDANSTGHGFDIDSTNSQCNFDRLIVEGTDGWGFLGNPSGKFGTYEFRGCALGGISSTSFIPDQVYLPAAAMTAVTGTPNLIGLPGVGYPLTWQFDAATVELVTGSLPPLPNDWETFDAYIVWAATDTQAGAVLWDLNYAFIVEGALPSASNVAHPGAPVNSPAVTARVNRYKIASGKARGTAPMVLRVDRNAANASDTYPADAALLGVQIVRAS